MLESQAYKNNRLCYNIPTFRRGAAVARDPVKIKVAGSNPAAGAKFAEVDKRKVNLEQN